jgi:asparagine synthase (glutamine-hydrolysing)
MCGIAGVFYRDKAVDTETLKQLAESIQHRGPDESGIVDEGYCGLVHTRLSIVDLAGGHQPLTSDNDQLLLVANGEIYNAPELRKELEKHGRQFKTHSDCEAILHAYAVYGKEVFLKHIEGMFAFALYDKRDGSLILARDRLGMKPLFIAELPDGIAFGSELKAILPLLPTKSVNPDSLAQYLQNQFSAGRQTMLNGVERVLPGEYVEIRAGRLINKKLFWSVTDVERPQNISYEEAEAQFDELMETVMIQHMRADVPFGLFLSGGVDSSTLLALLSRYHDKPIRTFSVGYPGTDVRNELPVAERLAKMFNTEHTVLQPDAQATLHRLPQVVWAADDLMRDNANLPTALLAEAAGKELKVVFSGEGGDESFAGYGRYRTSPIELALKKMIYPGSGGFRSRGAFRGGWDKKLFQGKLLRHSRAARQPFKDAWKNTPTSWDDLQRMQSVDIRTALADNLMVKADRMLMAHGVEGRLPFCDRRVVEFGLGLPKHLKIEGNLGKVFLRRWASRFVPEDILYSKKKGFVVPVGHWLRGETLRFLEIALVKHPVIQQWFNVEGVKQLIHQQHKSNSVGSLLIAIMQYALWHDLFVTGQGRRPDNLLDPIELLMEAR